MQMWFGKKHSLATSKSHNTSSINMNGAKMNRISTLIVLIIHSMCDNANGRASSTSALNLRGVREDNGSKGLKFYNRMLILIFKIL